MRLAELLVNIAEQVWNVLCISCRWVAGQKSTTLMYKKLRTFAWKEVGGSLHDYISRLWQCPGNLNCLKKSKYKLIQLDNIDVKKDPVRPELDVKFRTSHGRKIYGLRDPEGDVCAIMCFAFTDDVPKTVEEMDDMSKTAQMNSVHRAGQQGSIAIAYTVWAVKRGGGRRIVNEVYKMVKKSNNLNRLVTLSPLTDMARKFHLANGAKELQVNETSQNFEYDIELEQWEKVLDRAKQLFSKKAV